MEVFFSKKTKKIIDFLFKAYELHKESQKGMYSLACLILFSLYLDYIKLLKIVKDTK